MADFTRSVELIFGGKDNVSPTIKNITRSLDEFDSRVQSLAAPVGAVADDILKIDAAIIAVGGAMIAFATGEAIRFESAQLDLQKVLSKGEGSVDQYRQKIRDLSLQYGVLATDTTASVADFKQANFSIADSLKLVEASLIAVKISELDSAQASELLKTTLIGFNLSADDAISVLDTWNESSNSFNTNTKEIATGLSELAPIADLVGLSLDQTAALLIPIIERFGSGTEASKALRTGLLSMIESSKATRDALANLGVAQKDANGEIRNAGNILRDVQVAFQTLTPEQQLYNAGLLVGKDQAARLVPVLTGLNKQLEVQAVLDNKAGSAMAELAVRMQAAEESMKRLKVAFADAQRAIGDQFLTSVKGSSDELGKLFVAIADVVDSGGLAPLFNLMQPLFLEFNQDIAAIAKNLPQAFAGVDFSGLVSAFENIGGDISGILKDLFGDFNIETVEGLQTVLQGTVNGIEALVNITRGIIQELQPIFASIGTVIQSTGNVSTETEIAIGRFLGAGKVIADFGTAIGGVLLIVRETGADVLNVFNLIIGSARIAINALQIAFDTVALTIVETLRQLNQNAALITFGDLSATFQANADELRYIGNGIRENMSQNAADSGAAWDQFTSAFSGNVEDINRHGSEINTTVNGIASNTEQATSDLNQSGLTLEQVFANAGKAIDPVTGVITDLSIAANDSSAAAEVAGEKTKKWIETIVDGVPTFTQAGGKIQDSYKKTGESADEAKKKSDEFLIKMEQIASDERIANIEAGVRLNIAELESDAKVAVSIIEGLSTSIQSTTDLIGNLFGILTDADKFEQGYIKRQIELENKNREKELDLQEKLVEAQVSILNEKTKKLRDGDSLITITADGLEPELEAFMMAILRRVQIKAAEDQSLYLLGLPAVA